MSPLALTLMCAERSGRLYEGHTLTSNPQPSVAEYLLKLTGTGILTQECKGPLKGT